MNPTITIHDEAILEPALALTLDVRTARITARDLIRWRVHEEVRTYNRSGPAHLGGVSQTSDAERVLNGDRLPQRPPIDADEQCRHALAAFERNGFFILVDNRQVKSLDEEIELQGDTEIRFIKLVPLAGG